MFKTGLTNNLCQKFFSCYQSKNTNAHFYPTFVYVDQDQVKFITDIVNGQDNQSDQIFALGMGQDGFMEMLSFSCSDKLH